MLQQCIDYIQVDPETYITRVDILGECIVFPALVKLSRLTNNSYYKEKPMSIHEFQVSILCYKFSLREHWHGKHDSNFPSQNATIMQISGQKRAVFLFCSVLFEYCFPGDFPRDLETYIALYGATAFPNTTCSQPKFLLNQLSVS